MRTALLPAILAVAALTAFSAQDPKTPKNKKATPAKADAPAAAQQSNAKVPDINQDYVIGAEDVISIFVYDQPQFEVKQQSVRPDGMITMNLVGEVKAMGKAPRDLEAEIAKILGEKYLQTTPRVSVRIDQCKSRYFFITGGVNKPGQYPLLVPTTVMEALVNAGGFRDFADQKHINVIRNNVKVVVFNFKDALAGKHAEKNILLQHGDIIAVKE